MEIQKFKIAILFIILVFFNSQLFSQVPLKHLPMPRIDESDSNKLELIDMEIDTIKSDPENPVPIVVTSHREQIYLHWWGNNQWNQIEVVKHDDASRVQTLSNEKSIFQRLIKAPWSNRVAVVAGKEYIYVFYKRRILNYNNAWIEGLFYNLYKYDNSSQMIEEILDSISFPIWIHDLDRTGYYLWAGYSESNERFYLITQTYSSSDNVAEDEIIEDLKCSCFSFEPGDIWRLDHLYLGEGGYDLEAKIEDNALYCLFREPPYAFSIDIPGESIVINDSNMDVPYLRKVVVRLDTFEVTEHQYNLPGGEHPQIQNIEPFIYTTDKIYSGIIKKTAWISVPSKNGIQIAPPYPCLMELDIKGFEKRVALFLDEEWIEAQLFKYDPLCPRTLTNCYSDNNNISHFYSPNSPYLMYINDHQLILISYPLAFSPVSLTNFNQVNEKEIHLDFMQQDDTFKALLIWRYSINPNENNSISNPLLFTVFDINHEQIPENNELENAQFSPFILSPLVDTGTIDELFRQSIMDKKLDVKNYIGGNLKYMTLDEGGIYTAYSDLGDGGCRIIFDKDLEAPEPDSVFDKSIDESSIADLTNSESKWVTLLQSGNWDNYGLKAYEEIEGVSEASPVCSIDLVLDTLINSGVLDIDDYGYVIHKEIMDYIQNNEILNPNPYTTAIGETEDDLAYYAAFKHKVHIYAGYPTTLDASACYFYGLDLTSAEYKWTISILNELSEPVPPFHSISFTGEPTYDFTFNLPCDYKINLEVIIAGNIVRTVEKNIKVDLGFWDQFWQIYTALSTNAFGEHLCPQSEEEEDEIFWNVYDSSLDLSKYSTEYRFDENNQRKEIGLKVNDRYMGEYRFLDSIYGQGQIEMRLPIHFYSEDLELTNWLGDLCELKSISATLNVGRTYTPAILTQEIIGSHNFTQGLSSILTTKPVGNLQLTASDVHIDLELTVSGRLLVIAASTVISALLGLGLVGLASLISGIRRRIWEALSRGGFITAAIWIAVLTIVINLTIVPIFEEIGNQIIKTKLERDSNRYYFIKSGFLNKAGLGLAEAIATRVMDCVRPYDENYESDYIADDDPDIYDIPEIQLNRMNTDQYKDFWQMIYVTRDKCKILIREPVY